MSEEQKAEIIKAGAITLDISGHLALVSGSRADLTPTEFGLLAALMRSPGRTFSRMELLRQVQDAAYDGYERTIDVHIRRLRKKIEPDPSNPRYILTERGVGYRFREEDE